MARALLMPRGSDDDAEVHRSSFWASLGTTASRLTASLRDALDWRGMHPNAYKSELKAGQVSIQWLRGSPGLSTAAVELHHETIQALGILTPGMAQAARPLEAPQLTRIWACPLQHGLQKPNASFCVGPRRRATSELDRDTGLNTRGSPVKARLEHETTTRTSFRTGDVYATKHGYLFKELKEYSIQVAIHSMIVHALSSCAPSGFNIQWKPRAFVCVMALNACGDMGNALGCTEMQAESGDYCQSHMITTALRYCPKRLNVTVSVLKIELIPPQHLE
eukprot:852064-Amphidinium_carterae.1